MDDGGLLSTGDAAAWLGLQKKTLELWRHQGKGPAYMKVGGRIRYRLADLEQWLASRRVEPQHG